MTRNIALGFRRALAAMLLFAAVMAGALLSRRSGRDFASPPVFSGAVGLSQALPEAVRRIYGSALSCFTIDEEFALTEYRNCGRFVAIPEGVKTIGEEVF